MIGSLDAPTLAGFVRKVISDKVDLVVTDDNKDYDYIDRNVQHESVKHSAGEYVRGEVHTNSIESFWIAQAWRHGELPPRQQEILPFYLNESSFRFNNRKNDQMFADLITTCSQ